MRIISLLIFLSWSLNLFAIELEHAPGEVACDDKTRVCTYIARNVDAGTFISKITRIMFPPGEFLNPQDGYFHADGSDKVLFYFKGGAESELHQRFVGLIPMIDSFDDFDLPAYVQVSVEVYTITDTGLTELALETSRFSEEVDGGTNQGLLEFAIDVGSKLVKAVFATQKQKKQIHRLTRVTQIIPNMRSINFSHITKLYVAPNSVTTKEETPGLVLQTKASISKRNNDIVELSNFNLTYGVQNKMEGTQPTVTTLQFSIPEIQIERDRSIVLVSSQTLEISKNSGWDLNGQGINLGKGSETAQAKLLLVTSARALTPQELAGEAQNPSLSATKKGFTAEEVKSLPVTSVPMNELLQSLNPYTIITATNDRFLMVRLSRELAGQDNVKKYVTVKISGGGIDQEETLTVEELMLKGLRLQPMSAEALADDLVKFKIKIAEYFPKGRGIFKVHHASWEKMEFLYSNNRNEFIK